MFQISKRLKSLSFNGWTVVAIAIAALISTPVLFVLSSIFADSGEVWSHLASTVLPRYLLNSFLLSVGVGICVSVIGVGTAWLVTMCQFVGRSSFEWGLLLPFAEIGRASCRERVCHRV